MTSSLFVLVNLSTPGSWSKKLQILDKSSMRSEVAIQFATFVKNRICFLWQSRIESTKLLLETWVLCKLQLQKIDHSCGDDWTRANDSLLFTQKCHTNAKISLVRKDDLEWFSSIIFHSECWSYYARSLSEPLFFWEHGIDSSFTLLKTGALRMSENTSLKIFANDQIVDHGMFP